MRIMDWSSDVCSSDLHSSRELIFGECGLDCSDLVFEIEIVRAFAFDCLADRKTCVGCETDCLCNGRSTRPISIIVRLDRFHHFLDDLGRVFWIEDRKWPVHSENVDILIDDLRCG